MENALAAAAPGNAHDTGSQGWTLEDRGFNALR